MNAERQLTAFSQGNGISTAYGYDPTSGRLTSQQAGTANSVQNQAYTYDTIGNLLSRTDSAQSPSLAENFTYDALNRLTEAAIVDGPTAKTFAYDSIGNITSKSDVGSYSYPATSAARPHAVSSITGTVNGIVNPTFTYDANGNPTAGLGRSLTWTSYNQVATVTRGTTTLSFTHDSDHQRIKQYVSTTQETTVYINAQVRSEKLLNNSGGLIRWNNYIYAAGSMVAVFYDNASSADQTRYFHKDHLGSIAAITDESGTVVERLNYDAWGKRRFSNGADDTNETVASLTDRGYTGHEHLQEVALIHMNGRIYDPQLGRFMSADPFIQDPFDTQSLNRYSYVKNNPLAFTDPSGYFFKSVFRAISSILSNPRALIAIAAAVAIGHPELAVAKAIGATSAAAVAGAVAGGIMGGDLKSVVIGAASGGAFGAIGGTSWSTFEKAVAMAAVGGAASTAAGGNFASGFLAAGITAYVGPILPDFGTVGNAIKYAVVGGAAATVGGGKFANGAVTGAFAYVAGQIANGVASVTGSAGEYGGPDFSGDERSSSVVELEKKWVNPTGREVRRCDSKGCGDFGASRTDPFGGVRPHEGVDYVAAANQDVLAITEGRVTAIGYPYKNSSYFRYVQIATGDGFQIREMYVSPSDRIFVGARVSAGQVIGTAQSLQSRYRGITDHVHIEIRQNGRLVNPRELIPER